MVVIVRKTAKKNSWLFYTALFIIIVLILLFTTNTGPRWPIYALCTVQSGYICMNPLLHDYSFTIRLFGQNTGTTWENTSLLWIPNGQIVLPAGSFCPPAGSNTIDNGISCALPRQINLTSGQNVSINFTFSIPIPVNGKTYDGQIWANYQTTPGGRWYEIQVAAATLIAQ